MPTPTFFNLPDEKRQRFTDLAFEEFAANDYENASVSRIVARAGIAKGSLYQYFKDKQDLYYYLLSLASQQKQEFTAALLQDRRDVPVFTQLRELFTAMLKFQEEYPLMARVGNRVLNTNSPLSKELVERARTAAQQQFSDLFERGKASGEIRPDADTAAAGFILSAVILEAGNQPALTLADFENIYGQLLAILQNGLAGPKNQRKED